MNTTTLPITKARINLGAVVQGVATSGDSVILERAGNPMAAIINIDTLTDIMDSADLAYCKKTSKSTTDWDTIKHKYGI